jgi:hypothetical protein
MAALTDAGRVGHVFERVVLPSDAPALEGGGLRHVPVVLRGAPATWQQRVRVVLLRSSEPSRILRGDNDFAQGGLQ